MDVEMTSEENKDNMNPPIGCDNEAVVAEDTGPCPKHVTDAELGVLQVKKPFPHYETYHVLSNEILFAELFDEVERGG